MKYNTFPFVSSRARIQDNFLEQELSVTRTLLKTDSVLASIKAEPSINVSHDPVKKAFPFQARSIHKHKHILCPVKVALVD